MPDSVLIPAPVNTAIRFPRSSSESRSSAPSSGMARIVAQVASSVTGVVAEADQATFDRADRRRIVERLGQLVLAVAELAQVALLAEHAQCVLDQGLTDRLAQLDVASEEHAVADHQCTAHEVFVA